MKMNPEKLRNISKYIVSSSWDTGSLYSKEIRRLVKQGYGINFFRAVHALCQEYGMTITEEMEVLEKFMEYDEPLAGYLMAHFFPIASRKKNHEVCNGIELWMYNCDNKDLYLLLVTLTNEPIRPTLKARYSSWIQAIEKNIQNAKGDPS